MFYIIKVECLTAGGESTAFETCELLGIWCDFKIGRNEPFSSRQSTDLNESKWEVNWAGTVYAPLQGKRSPEDALSEAVSPLLSVICKLVPEQQSMDRTTAQTNL